MLKVNVIRKQQPIGIAEVTFHGKKACTLYDIKKGDILQDEHNRQHRITSIKTFFKNDRPFFIELNYKDK